MELNTSNTKIPSLIVRGGFVATINSRRDVLKNSAVAITDSVISEIGDFEEIRRKFPDVSVIGTPTSVVTPGYINAHQHLTGDRYLRSAIPDTISSNDAIFKWIVPLHELLTATDDRLSTTAGLVEALSNGVTFTVEAGTVAHPHEVARAFVDVGARGTVGRWGWDIGQGPQVAPTSVVLERQKQLLEDFGGKASDNLVTAWVTLVGHDLMSDELVTKASQLARDYQTHLTFHIAPHEDDVKSYLSRTGKRPITHFHDLGVLGDHVLLAHAVHIDEIETNQIIESGTAVVSCPWAYLRLAQGITGHGRHADLIRRNARIALGCDSENAGDAIDMIRTAALFVGLTRDGERDFAITSAHDALDLVTIRGAQAIGMDHLIGSIEVGKLADIVIHSTDGPQWTPISPDPVLQLIWASDGRSVSDVVVNGKHVVSNGSSLMVDEPALRAELTARAQFFLNNHNKV